MRGGREKEREGGGDGSGDGLKESGKETEVGHARGKGICSQL
jgi:hypothetical protein